MNVQADVLIIGAGPSGSVAAANLIKHGLKVVVFEKENFPRFSIGESLLPQSLGLLEEAGLLRAVIEAGFQYKNGATFVRGERRTDFDFRDKHSAGWGTAFQVQRAQFDKVLADTVAGMGAEIRYEHEILAASTDAQGVQLRVRGPKGEINATGRFLLDASGFARVLPRLMQLESPSSFPMRQALFAHVIDHIPADSGFDRNKILVTTHPEHIDVWYWLIPFSNGRCSLGIVAEKAFFAPYENDLDEGLKALQREDPRLRALLKDAKWEVPVRKISGYSADVKSLHGQNFALLGNAGEFLDPVFSSGVTIALKSASMASALVARQMSGRSVDWQSEYGAPLKRGVDAFRAFVESWYRGAFQDIIFYEKQDPAIRRMICAILAGYAWDLTNPYVKEPRRLLALEKICAPA